MWSVNCNVEDLLMCRNALCLQAIIGTQGSISDSTM